MLPDDLIRENESCSIYQFANVPPLAEPGSGCRYRVAEVYVDPAGAFTATVYADGSISCRPGTTPVPARLRTLAPFFSQAPYIL